MRLTHYACLCFLCLFASGAAESNSSDAVRKGIGHAETYFWFGMAQKGDMGTFALGLAHLGQAEEALRSAGQSIPDEHRRSLQREIEALRGDLREQAHITHDTFYGVFPVVKLLSPSLFADAAANGMYELVDDPDVISATCAVSAVIDDVLLNWLSQTQLDVVFASVPHSPALENEALYLFNAKPKFFVHNAREVVAALSEQQLAEFRSGRVSPEVVSRLSSSWGSAHLLVVTVRELDIVGEDYFFLAEGRVYEHATHQIVQSFSSMGFCRDRRSQLRPIIVTHVALLLLAVAIYSLMARLTQCGWPGWREALGVPAVAFLAGRVLPWVLVPVTSAVAPPAENLAVLSFWWPCLLGAVTCIVPAVVCKVVSGRFRHVFPVLKLDRRGSSVFVGLALGTCAHLSGVYLLHMQTAVVPVAFMVVTLGSLAYVLGSALDRLDPMPPSVAVLPLVMAPIAGLVICLGRVGFLGVLGTVAPTSSALLLVWVRWRQQRESREQPAADRLGTCTGAPASVAALATASIGPAYVAFGTFERAMARLAPALEGRPARLGLHGERGTGKTATCSALVAAITERLRQQGHDQPEQARDILLLRGNCPEPVGDPVPYAPFQEALSRHFGVNLLGRRQTQMERLDAALDSMFESAVPFAGLLFPPTEGERAQASSKKEVFIAVASMLRKLADPTRRRTVVLLIDDVQWIDPGSAELLAFLLAGFEEGTDVPMAIVVAGRDAATLTRLGLGAQALLPVETLNAAQRGRILQQSLGIEADVASALVRKVGSGAQGSGELFWLLSTVGYLARRGYFRKTAGGFTWSEAFDGVDALPIPEDLRKALDEQMAGYPEYLHVLECAACLGQEFSVEVLAQSLEMSRMHVLRLLDRIEKDTGILWDCRERDDRYAFRSSFMLEEMRRRMSISGRGPKAKDVPQVIRELHRRIAASLEGTSECSTARIFEVATHYYAAGLSQAEKAHHYCIQAALAASKQFQHGQARRCLDMAQECSEALGRTSGLEVERIRILCHEAHVGGANRSEAADAVLAYLTDTPEEPFDLLILAARSCYDAGRFDEAARMARRALGRASSTVEESEAHHLLGVSRPRDEDTDRETHLRRAYALVADSPENDLWAQELLGRVCNSLAEHRSYGPNEQKRDAETLFLKSIKIKSRPDLRDKPGLARSHGGLGRLHFFDKELVLLPTRAEQLSKARESFRRDAALCEDVGDVLGKARMHSFLGACDREEGLFEGDDVSGQEGAIHHYRESYRLAKTAGSHPDVLFAGAGLMGCYALTGAADELNSLGEALAHAAQTVWGPEGRLLVPEPCIEAVRASLDQCADCATGDWHGTLTEFVLPRPGAG